MPNDSRMREREREQEREIKRLHRVIRRAEVALCRASTVVYRDTDVRSLNRALDKIGDGVGKVIDTLRMELP